jgi:hypothetical protein
MITDSKGGKNKEKTKEKSPCKCKPSDPTFFLTSTALLALSFT